VRKVISTALFGSGDDYAKYLPALVRSRANLFPQRHGWELVIYVGEDVDIKWRDLLWGYARRGLLNHASHRPKAELTRAMLWRMHPVFAPEYDYVFPRDMDALLMPRDLAVCNMFIESKCDVHTVHDSDQHHGIMGGLCGFRAPSFREVTGWSKISDLDAAANETDEGWAKKGTDQDVLNRVVGTNPNIKLFEHCYAGWHNGRGTATARVGSYGAQSWSIPTPNGSKSRFSPELNDKADRLAAHMGAAGYDHEAAVHFYDEHGDLSVTEAARHAERGIL
jgi:hypothetical protein